MLKHLARLASKLRSVKGLGTVPGLIALFLWGLSLISISVDAHFPEFSASKAMAVFYTDYETAKAILSTVASASITTLGLVYSIVLVVFTTAAGNIGPRLLQRFTGDNTNQFTAGLFGGTFLFSLTVLHQTDPGFVPAFSIAFTFLLAGLSVLQLIYFVHTASRSVTIDEEVAEIATQLEGEVEAMIAADDADRFQGETPKIAKSHTRLGATDTGYIATIDVDRLVALAQEHNVFFALSYQPGGIHH